MRRIMYSLIGLGLVVGACSPSTEIIPTSLPTNTPIPEEQAVVTAQPTVTSTPQPTIAPTDTPTTTFTPQPTLPPATLAKNAAQVAVNASETVYLRLQPGIGGEIDRVLYEYTPLKVIGRTEEGEWLQVKISDGAEGWVLATQVETDTDVASLDVTGIAITEVATATPAPEEIVAEATEETTAEATEEIVYIEGEGTTTVPALRLREQPSTDGEIVQQMREDTSLTIVERTDDNSWFKVRLEDGETGWVAGQYVATDVDLSKILISDVEYESFTTVASSSNTNTTTNDPETQTNAAVASGNDATVIPEGDGLRVRSEPGFTGTVLANLPASSGLDVVGRTNDNKWIEVRTGAGSGWVSGGYLSFIIDINSVPVTGETIVVVPPAEGPQINSVVSGVTSRSAEIFRVGQTLGNRRNVFSKIGDSLTVATYVMYPMGWGSYQLGGYAGLQPALNFFSTTNAREGNSFANVSIAADNGWTTADILNPSRANPGVCSPGESPLVCEYRVVKPSVAMILIGTNDVSDIPLGTYQGNLQVIIQTSIDMGVIPVLTTIPNRAGFDVGPYNQAIISTARGYDVPLVDYWSAMQGLPNTGLSDDGVHPSWTPGDFANSADFKAENLQYGYVIRNITVLQALDAVWRNVIALN